MSLITSFFYLLSSYLKRINNFYLKWNYAVWYLACNKTCRKHEVKKKKGTVNQTRKLKHFYYRKMASLTIYLFHVSYFYFLPFTICLCSAFFFKKHPPHLASLTPSQDSAWKKPKSPMPKPKKHYLFIRDLPEITLLFLTVAVDL